MLGILESRRAIYPSILFDHIGASWVLQVELREIINFSVDANQIIALMEANAIAAAISEDMIEVSPVQMTRNAADITVLVSCW